MRYFLSLIVVILVVVLSGCGPQVGFGPEDIVTIHGVFQDEDGTAFKFKEIGIWVLSLEGFSIMNYWYPDPDSRDYTDSTGAYEFEYKGKDLTWGTTGASMYVIIANREPSTGPMVALGFYPTEIDEDLGPVKLWNGNPQATVQADSATFTWTDMQTTHGITPNYYSLKVRALGWFDLWQIDSLQTTYTVPTYVFQNKANGWRVEAQFPRATDNDSDVVYCSVIETSTLLSTTPNLLSKDKRCYAEGSGNLDFTKVTNQIWHEGDGGDERFNNTKPTYLYIDLGDTTHTVEAVVVYGLNTSFQTAAAAHGGFKVYVANDTTNWGIPVDSTAKESGYFYLEGFSKQGRYVKLAKKAVSNLQINSIKEIGIFGE